MTLQRNTAACSAIRALAWEQWRHARMLVVGGTFTMVVFAQLTRALTALEIMRRAGDAEMLLNMVPVLTAFVLIGTLTLTDVHEKGARFGFNRRSYRLPVSTALLVITTFTTRLLCFIFTILIAAPGLEPWAFLRQMAGGAAIATLPIAPFATIPLAMNRQRHNQTSTSFTAL